MDPTLHKTYTYIIYIHTSISSSLIISKFWPSLNQGDQFLVTSSVGINASTEAETGPEIQGSMYSPQKSKLVSFGLTTLGSTRPNPAIKDSGSEVKLELAFGILWLTRIFSWVLAARFFFKWFLNLFLIAVSVLPGRCVAMNAHLQHNTTHYPTSSLLKVKLTTLSSYHMIMEKYIWVWISLLISMKQILLHNDTVLRWGEVSSVDLRVEAVSPPLPTTLPSPL